MTGKDERNELKAKDLAQVSGGNWFKDVVKYATTGVPGVVYDMVSGGGGGGDSSGGGAIAVSTGGGDSDGGTNPLQTTPAPGPAYTQNNSNNSGVQQNSQNGNNHNEGGMNVTP